MKTLLRFLSDESADRVVEVRKVLLALVDSLENDFRLNLSQVCEVHLGLVFVIVQLILRLDASLLAFGC